MQIKVISKGDVVSKQGKKPYNEFELIYSVDGQVKQRKILSFNDVYKVLLAANSGEYYDVEAVKEGEFWQWKKAVKVDGSVQASMAKPSASGGKANTYDEFQERKQILIVRQNALTNAVSYAASTAGLEQLPDVNAVLQTAEKFANWVLKNPLEDDDDDTPEVE